MDNTILILLILSSFLQIVFVRTKYKTYNNPIVFFNIAFFLHNWSDLFVTALTEEEVGVLIPYSITNQTIAKVAIFNLIAMWAFFIGVNIARTWKTKVLKPINYDFGKFYSFYLVFAVLQLIYSISTNKIHLTYGVGQALTSSEAFSPIGTFLNARIIIGAAYIIDKNSSRKKNLVIIITELLFAILLGGRKALVMVLFAYFLPKINKIRFADYLKILVVAPLAAFAIGFLNVLRGFIGTDMSFQNKLYLAINLVATNTNAFTNFLIKQLASASSEGVQCWTYSLIETGQLSLMYGKTYIQAVINMFILRPFQGPIANWQAAYTFKSVAYPNVTNMGYDFSFMAEALLNFGTYLYWIPYLILGIFMQRIRKLGEYNNFYEVLYYITWIILFITFRTDSTSTFRYLSYFIFFWFITNKVSLKFKNQ